MIVRAAKFFIAMLELQKISLGKCGGKASPIDSG
jgi:hypothetical protein